MTETNGPMSSDQQPNLSSIWDQVIAAQRSLTRSQAAFFSNADGRLDFLKAALAQKNGVWGRTTALKFLIEFPTDVSELADHLFELCLTTGALPHAREALAAGDRAVIIDRFHSWIRPRWHDFDENDLALLMSLAERLEDQTLVQEIRGQIANQTGS